MATSCSRSAARTRSRPSRAIPGVDSLYYCRLKPRPAHALDGECRLLAGAERLEERLFDLRFSLLAQSFFQVNAAQAERMYAIALDALELKAGDGVLDAYCGAGTLTLLAAARGAMATGVEIVRPAVLDARANAKRNGLSEGARFLLGDAAQEIPRLVRAGERFSAAILDPPRRGADARVLEALLLAAPERIAYISCGPPRRSRATSRRWRQEAIACVSRNPWICSPIRGMWRRYAYYPNSTRSSISRLS